MSPKSQWMVLGGALACYLGLFGWFYPVLPGIEDEVGFLNQAYVWSHGTTDARDLGHAELASFLPVGERVVGWRNPGRPLTLVPFFWAGIPDAVFWSGAAVHLVTVLAAALTLRALGRAPLWAVLVLAHPTLALYSRTVMSDGLCGLFLMLAALAFVRLRRPGFAVGLLVGAACVVRYQAAIVVPGIALALMLTDRFPKPWREAAWYLVAVGAVGLGIVAYNLRTFGTIMGPTHQGYFAAQFVVPHLALYAVCLMLFWPGMLPAILVSSPLRGFAVAACGPYVAFLVPYYFHDTGASWVETLVVGQRLISPALPVWIVCYGVLAERLLAGRVGAKRAVVGVAVVGLLAAITLLFARHQTHLHALATARDAVAGTIPDGSPVVARGSFEKLFALPYRDGPHYQFVPDPTAHDRVYLADLPKGATDVPDEVDRLRRTHRVTVVPVSHPRLTVYLIERLR